MVGMAVMVGFLRRARILQIVEELVATNML
jgi:hypothetical protein